ncbi:MAG: helix-turn-helix transcriptional regulator [Microcoleus anatoxicus]|uniref:helix-turn-helix domain-containing protein n=1 Tax=Microcoleus anatoxicus TaxID=2705319 RepID=UPI0036723F6C
MSLVRIRVRELATERGWTFTEVAERSGVVYSKITTYVRRSSISMVDFRAIDKLARAFGVMI